MALKTLVKVGNISNLSDARYCAGMGVDFLGFQVVEGKQEPVSPKTYQEIRGWITGPQIVAEIYDLGSADLIAAIIENYQPDYFELSLSDFMRVGHALTLPYILQLNEGEELPEFATPPAYLQMDIRHVSPGKFVSEYEIIARITSREDLTEALDHTGISGVGLTGGSEIRPGLKTFDDLADILEALEQD